MASAQEKEEIRATHRAAISIRLDFADSPLASTHVHPDQLDGAPYPRSRGPRRSDYSCTRSKCTLRSGLMFYTFTPAYHPYLSWATSATCDRAAAGHAAGATGIRVHSGHVRGAAWLQARPPSNYTCGARQGKNNCIYIDFQTVTNIYQLQYTKFGIFLPYSTIIIAVLITFAFPRFLRHAVS